jgi:hypothetical protein
LHKASLSKYKKTEITPCLISNHNALKLELKKNSSKKYTKKLKAEEHIAQLSVCHRRNKKKSKDSWKLMKIKTPPTKTYGTQEKQS